MLDTILVVPKEGQTRTASLRFIGQLEGLVDLYAERELNEKVAQQEARMVSSLVYPAEVIRLLGGETAIKPALCLLPYEPALLGAPLGPGVQPLVPIAWRMPKPPEVNLWHVVHEWAEAHLVLSLPTLPRWAKEGLAQLAAYIYFRQQVPHLLPNALDHYTQWGRLGEEDFFSWPDLRARIGQGDPLASLAEWAVSGHESPQEKARYATALEVFKQRYGELASLAPLLERIKNLSVEALKQELMECFAA